MVVQKNGEIESSITLTISLPLCSSIFAALVMGCLAELINYFILLKEGLRSYPLKETISFINLIRVIPA